MFNKLLLYVSGAEDCLRIFTSTVHSQINLAIVEIKCCCYL